MRLIDLTPQGAKCPPPACPGVFKDEETGDYFLIGRTDELPAEIVAKVGHGECAIRLPASFASAFTHKQ